jgi:DNA-binding response OmpR family regulator
MKILLVEDQNELRGLVKNFLEKNGYIVDEAEDGEIALEYISTNQYDCIILDLNLPKVDGIDVAKRIKKDGITTPIIMLTARSQIYDKLMGFDTGADDYITKPFDMKELLARIKVVLRRGSSHVDNNKLFFGYYEIFPESNLLKKDSKEISLSNKEMGILEYMVTNPGKIIAAEELLEHVWDREVDMFSDTVKTHIKTLRKKIDPKKKNIKTVRGKGYVYEE